MKSVHQFCAIFCCILLHLNAHANEQASIYGSIEDATNGKIISKAEIWIEENGRLIELDGAATYRINNLKVGTYHLTFFASGYNVLVKKITLESAQAYELNISMTTLESELLEVEVLAENDETVGIRRLCNVEGVGIYAAKKNEVIVLSNVVANLATNNARQVYKGIAGLNIWESDGAGLQLSIGARGLDPNRTSNFNTRQNGYDISADALGYPESYYTPPTQALERIEIVRGAASLQYGPQFGGLLNFILKKGNKEKALEFTTENTVGSFGLLTSFNSLSGSKNGWNYYAFYQRKQGDGWRENAKFHQNTAYASISKKLGKRSKIGLEYTYMDYLAQQAGGLQDYEFYQNPRQSKRSRNWFKVNWNLGALNFDHRFSDQTKLNSRSFVLMASRSALGELGPINRPDPMRERDLVKGDYLNFGNETRLIHTYNIKGRLATFLVGGRYYQGYAESKQGDADDGSKPNFEFLNPDNLERAAYQFPSRNLSFFAENLFNINDRWTLTPGARFEYIRTASDGYYKYRVLSGGEVIFEEQITDTRQNQRHLVLLGLGSGYKFGENIEVYTNFSQNYRSINFTDMAVVNPNLIVDPDLKDEKGFNADLGFRANFKQNKIRLDASLFYLQYKDRIGVGEIVVPDPVVVEKAVAYRTNIGDARILGLEAYVEADIWQLFADNEQTHFSCSIFANASVLNGKYTKGMAAFEGNEVELIPPFSMKTGVNFAWKSLKFAYQYAYTATQYSDATNAAVVVDATRGLIPAYSVQDLSLSYSYRQYRLQAGVNNLTNASYFTRRATAYPGPGIIPADGRSFYVSLSIKI